MTQFKSTVIRGILTLGSLPLFAQSPIVVPWHGVCAIASGQELIATTDAGESLQGYCVSVNADEILLRTKDNGVVRIARRSLSHLALYRPPVHPFRSLRKGVQIGLRKGGQWLFSPLALIGIVTIPGTLAWGAISAPFCLLGELQHRQASTQEIKPM